MAEFCADRIYLIVTLIFVFRLIPQIEKKKNTESTIPSA